MAHYGMVIDLTRCFGCHACEVACKIANNNPAELDYNRVHTVAGTGQTDPVTYDTASGTYPNCSLAFLPMQCQHCENAERALVVPRRGRGRGRRAQPPRQHGGEVHLLPQPHLPRRGSRLHAALPGPRPRLGRPRRPRIRGVPARGLPREHTPEGGRRHEPQRLLPGVGLA